MPRIFLRDAVPGDLVEDVFVVSGKQLSATSNGKHFIKASVSDRTLSVNARIWNATREMFNAMPESGFIRLRGRIENYQNNLQLIIEQMWPPKEGTYQVADLLPTTTKDIPAMWEKLKSILGSLQSRYVGAIVQAYLDDRQLMDKFCRAPAAMSFHHAFIGGLLEHTLNALEVADAVVIFYPRLSRDLVLAGIFLHDIAKTWELSYETAFGYTDGGQLVGHVVKSAMWIEDKARVAEQKLGQPIPRNVVEVLQHIILSHHGLPEFGAAKVPATPEAIAVHMIENLDAKLMMSLSATRGDSAASGAEGNWSEYVKAMGTRMYRPDVSLDTGNEDEIVPTATPEAEAPPAQPLGGGIKINNPLFEQSSSRKK